MRRDNDIPSFSPDVSDGFKLAKRGLGAFLIAWLLYAVLCVSAVGVLVYVAWHFVSKSW